jgi:hypothetical protein
MAAKVIDGAAKGMTVLHNAYGDSAMLPDIVKIALTKWPAASARN